MRKFYVVLCLTLFGISGNEALAETGFDHWIEVAVSTPISVRKAGLEKFSELEISERKRILKDAVIEVETWCDMGQGDHPWPQRIVRGLGEFGEKAKPALPALYEILSDLAYKPCDGLVEIFSRIGLDTGTYPIGLGLASNWRLRPEIRSVAIEQLTRMTFCPEHIKDLFSRLLSDRDVQVQAAAKKGLSHCLEIEAEIASRVKPVFEQLVSTSTVESENGLNSALSLGKKERGEVISALVKELEFGGGKRRGPRESRIVRVLGEFGREALPYVYSALNESKDASCRTRMESSCSALLDALAWTGRDRRDSEYLLILTHHQDPVIREAATNQLFEMRADNEDVRRRYSELLFDPFVEVQEAAIRGLSRCGGIDLETVRRLIPLLGRFAECWPGFMMKDLVWEILGRSRFSEATAAARKFEQLPADEKLKNSAHLYQYRARLGVFTSPSSTICGTSATGRTLPGSKK